MSKYIDADKLIDKLEELQFNAPVMTPVMKIYNVIELVEDQPTADVVEVVRCCDCRMFVDNKEALVTYCRRECKNLTVKPTDFCSYGERRSEE